MLNSFPGERSVCKVLVQKGHLCFMDSVIAWGGWRETGLSTDKYVRATKSTTMLRREEAGGSLRWADAWIDSMRRVNWRHDNGQHPGLAPASAWLSERPSTVRLSDLQDLDWTEGITRTAKCSTVEPPPNLCCENLTPALYQVLKTFLKFPFLGN